VLTVLLYEWTDGSGWRQSFGAANSLQGLHAVQCVTSCLVAVRLQVLLSWACCVRVQVRLPCNYALRWFVWSCCMSHPVCAVLLRHAALHLLLPAE